MGYDTEPEYVAIAEQRVAEERARRPAQRSSCRSATLEPTAASAPTTSRPVDQDDQDADFQRRATEEGKAAQAIAEKVLDRAPGSAIVGRNARLRGLGMTMNFVAVDQRDEEWYFDVSGAFSSNRGGLRRTDTLWKSLGPGPRAGQLARSRRRRWSCSPRTCPRPGTDGDRALHAATADAFFDAIEMYDLEGQARLQAYARGEHDGRPWSGSGPPRRSRSSRRWASP